MLYYMSVVVRGKALNGTWEHARCMCSSKIMSVFCECLVEYWTRSDCENSHSHQVHQQRTCCHDAKDAFSRKCWYIDVNRLKFVNQLYAGLISYYGVRMQGIKISQGY